MAPDTASKSHIDELIRKAKQHLSWALTNVDLQNFSGVAYKELLPDPLNWNKGFYREIGRGSFGTVYECCGTTEVIKVVQLVGEEITHDYVEHKNMWLATQRVLPLVGGIQRPQDVPLTVARIPQPYQMPNLERPSCKDFWNDAAFIGAAAPVPLAAFYRAERILPLPRETTQALMHAFLPQSSWLDCHYSDIKHPVCIARIYLGCRTSWLTPSDAEPPSTVENFPLFVDQLEELNIATDVLAAEMALTLATAHWAAGNDLYDAEFVLGSTPPGHVYRPLQSEHEVKRLGADETTFDCKTKGSCLWLTDFDKTKKVQRTARGMKQAARAAETNDPYFPKPPSDVSTAADDRLWEVFEATYLEASEAILNEEFRSALNVEGRAGGLLKWIGLGGRSVVSRSVDEVRGLPRVFLEEWKKLRGLRVAKCWFY